MDCSEGGSDHRSHKDAIRNGASHNHDASHSDSRPSALRLAARPGFELLWYYQSEELPVRTSRTWRRMRLQSQSGIFSSTSIQLNAPFLAAGIIGRCLTKSSFFNDVHNIGYTFFRDRRQAHESVKMTAKTADEHVRMRKQLRRISDRRLIRRHSTE